MSKLGKFRRGPAVFFEDAKLPWVRSLGRRLSPWLEGPLAEQALLDPLTALEAMPAMSALAQAARSVAQRRRTRAIVEAKTPLVTVIMAAWNSSQTIEAALQSLREQSYANIEVLVIDDGSSDRTRELVGAAAAQDSRIRLVKSPGNYGAAHARNLGLEISTGRFITFHDSDDRSHPERIERQLCALLLDPSRMFCLCNYSRVDEHGNVLSINGRKVSKSVISMMFRRSVFRRQGYFKPYRISEDSEYYSRMRAIYGEQAGTTIFKVLYLQGFSPDSLLFSDGVTRAEADDVFHERSEAAQDLLREIQTQHQRIREGQDDGYVAFARQTRPVA